MDNRQPHYYRKRCQSLRAEASLCVGFQIQPSYSAQLVPATKRNHNTSRLSQPMRRWTLYISIHLALAADANRVETVSLSVTVTEAECLFRNSGADLVRPLQSNPEVVHDTNEKFSLSSTVNLLVLPPSTTKKDTNSLRLPSPSARAAMLYSTTPRYHHHRSA